jgi:two-component system phosphate regulon sensor histidine kinase PhoR
VSVAIARAIAHPIQALTDSAIRLAHGQPHRPLPLGAGGEVGELAGAFDDMAERVRAHVKSIEEERGRLAAMLANIPDGVIITNGAGEITLINAAAERLLRLSADSAGRRLIEVVRDHEIVDLVDQALRPGAAPVTRLIELDVGDGRASIQAIGVSLPAGPDSEGRALVVLQDVTELRRVESVRRDFVANVSHELRTPVASLKAMVETLEGGALDDPAAARDFLARMHVEVDDLIQLIEELLELSRIESGRVTLRLQPMDPGPVVAAAVERLQTQAQRQGLDLALKLDDDRPQVVIDPDRLQQVVMNLVHNAIKFTEPGGCVLVKVGRHDGEVHVRVQDSGVGIAPDELGRLFERFYKVDRSRSSGGTGLGLAIAKHLTQAHGGRVWAESAGPGRGATFVVAIPSAPTEFDG